MAVTQVSVFLENRPGSLNEVLSILGEAGVNIRALSLADTARYGILRMMVSDVKKAVRALVSANIAASTTPVFAVEVPDRPGGLAKILGACAAAGLNIEYLYAFVSNGSNNDYGDIIEDQVRPYPVDYAWEQFDVGPWDYEHPSGLTINASGATLESGRRRISGNLRVNGSDFHLQDALIVCTGAIDFNGSNVALDRVTLVAQGAITFNGSTERFSCYQDDLFAFSLSGRATALKVNGSDSDTRGILFAPNGGMVYNGSAQEVHHGGLVALTIDVNGSGSIFEGMGEGSDEGFKQVKLIR